MVVGMCHDPLSPLVAGVFGAFDPLVAVELDRSLGNVKVAFAERAFVVLPPAMRFFQQGVGELFDRVVQRRYRALQFRAIPARCCDLDVAGRQRGSGVDNAGVDALDLAGVADAVEGDDDAANSGGGERVEDSSLVGGERLFGEAAAGVVLRDQLLTEAAACIK